jgi:hypothetical protein
MAEEKADPVTRELVGAPVAAVSRARSAPAAAVEPTYTPVTSSSGPACAGLASRRQVDHISSGVDGIHRCQAGRTVVAAAHGQMRVNRATGAVGKVSMAKDVTTPKLPPPPPRQAQ